LTVGVVYGRDQRGDHKVVTGLIKEDVMGLSHWGIWIEQLGDKEKLMGEGLSYWDKLQEKKKGGGTEECAVG
jgi:hypothetical protein